LRTAILLLLRVFAYLFEAGLSVFLIGVASFAGGNLKLGMLPWEGSTLAQASLGLGVAGILCIILAITGFIRWLFPIFTLAVLAMMFRGFFLSSYSFADDAQFKFAIWLTVGALVSFFGSLSLFGRRGR
jgi:hypothetical protein